MVKKRVSSPSKLFVMLDAMDSRLPEAIMEVNFYRPLERHGKNTMKTSTLQTGDRPTSV